MWDLSCPDWAERLRAGRSLVPTLPLNQAEASRALAIYNELRLPDVPGTPSLGEAGGEWFRDIVAAIFGALPDPVENPTAPAARNISEVFNLVPKKNSKTTNSAALMLTAMMMAQRPRADMLLIGPTQIVAEGCFGQAVGMIQADPDLKSRFHIQAHIKKITYFSAAGPIFLQIKTFSDDVLTGVKPIAVLVDEYHLLGKVASAARVMGQIRGGFLPFPEAFLAIITTQSDEAPAGVFLEDLLAARAIRDGRRPARGILPVLYEFPEQIAKSGAWRDPALWPQVTPNLNRSITLPRLIDDWERAQEKGDKEIKRWASQHLNLQIGVALYSDAWAGAQFWETCAAPPDAPLTLEALIERSEVCTIGIDGGGLDDLLGLAVLGREKGTRRWLLWCKAWAHASVLERRKTDVAPRLLDFEKLGEVVILGRVHESFGLIPDGGSNDDLDAPPLERPDEDIRQVVDIVETVWRAGKLPDKAAIGLDPVGISQIVDELAQRDMDTSDEAQFVIGIPQGWKLNNAILTLERRVSRGPSAIQHAGQALMNWCVGNAKVELRGGARTINKQTSGAAKIDPFIAALNAVALMSMDPEAGGSVYETQDLIIVDASAAA